MKPIYKVDLASIKDSPGSTLEIRDQITLADLENGRVAGYWSSLIPGGFNSK